MDISEKIKEKFGYFPTDEQLSIINMVSKGESVTVQAGAGSSKTTTMKFCRLNQPEKKALYLAYNKALVNEAKEQFDDGDFGNTTIKTFHGIAFSYYAKEYKTYFRESTGNSGFKGLMPKQIASIFKGVSWYIASMIKNSAENSFNDVDIKVKEEHIPQKFHSKYFSDIEKLIANQKIKEARTLFKKYEREKQKILKYANDYAIKCLDVLDDEIYTTHSSYLKRFMLDKVSFGEFDQIFIDEAQDLNEVQIEIIRNQDKKLQKIIVGDEYQAIYGWRGAKSSLKWTKTKIMHLSNSFRITPDTADLANAILDVDYSNRNFYIKGLSTSDRTKKEVKIFRTNLNMFKYSAFLIQNDKTFHINDESNRFFTIFQNMMHFYKGEFVSEIYYNNFEDLRFAIETGSEMNPDFIIPYIVIKNYGIENVENVLNYYKAMNQRKQGICLTTAHSSKGLEWDVVHVHDDFLNNDGELVGDSESINLLYVAVTRAKNVCNISSKLKDFLSDHTTKRIYKSLDPVGNKVCYLNHKLNIER